MTFAAICVKCGKTTFWQEALGEEPLCVGCWDRAMERLSLRAEANSRYRKAHKEEIVERNRVYREANRAEIAEGKRVCYLRHRRVYLKNQRLYGRAHRAEIAEYNGLYYLAHREEIAERKRVRYLGHKLLEEMIVGLNVAVNVRSGQG